MKHLKNVLILASLLLSGCAKDKPEPEVVVKKVFIKQNCPKKVKFPEIPTYTIKDWKDYNETYYLVNKKQFAESQRVCHKLRKVYLLVK